MGRIIDRALDIINDHLKDQTSSFSDPISIKPMARGGYVLEDDYPTQYLPHVGRQVMARGGEPKKGFEGRVSKNPPAGPTSWDEVPTINPNDLVGKKIFPIFADLTKTGDPYMGIDASQLEQGVPMRGGPGYPLIPENVQHGIAWAVEGKGRGTAKLGKDADYAVVMAMNPDTHKSNATFSRALIGNMQAYARDGRLSDENLQKLNDLVREPGTQKELQSLREFPGFEHPDAIDFIDGLSFEARKRMSDVLGSPGGQKLGAPNVAKIIRETADPQYAGVDRSAGLFLMELHPERGLSHLKEEGLPEHESYTYGVPGRIVGKFHHPVAAETLFKDFFDKKHAEAQQAAAEGKKTNVRRAFDLAMPVGEITQEIADMLPRAPKDIQSSQAARLALNVLHDRWHTSDDPVKEGGVSAANFSQALKDSDASSTLTQYSQKELNDMTRSGKFKAFKLRDGEVYFGLKRGTDYKEEYGFEHPELTPNETALVSVVNNEPGAKGIGGAPVVLKAIEHGATALDAFAVPSKKHPDGFLPDFYSHFGFKELGRVPFDPKYVSEQQLADMKHHWTKNGWDESMGLPSLAIMKWTGTDDDRKDALQKYLRQGGEGDRAGSDTSDVAASARALQQGSGPAGGEEGLGVEGFGRGDRGPVRTDSGARPSDRLSRTLAAVRGLTPTEAPHFGLTPEDVSQAQAAFAPPARAYGGAINPLENRLDNLDDLGRRLILYSYATAPLFDRGISRADGGEVGAGIDKALDIARGASGAPPTSAVDVARSLTPMGFYSAAAEAAGKIPQRAPIDQILNKVKGSPGVKAEELDWSGVKDAFAGQGSVDPTQVAQHLQENLPQIQEKIYGYDSSTKRKTLRRPRYEDYTTPGGNNYREILLHLPQDENKDERDNIKNEIIRNEAKARLISTSINPPRGYVQPDESEVERHRSDLNDVMAQLSQLKDRLGQLGPEKPDYQSGHWGERVGSPAVKNILAHLRLTDRGVQRFGSPETLHIEEVQSDWGQSKRDDKNVPDGPHIGSTEGWTDLALKRALLEAARGRYKRLTWTPGEEQAERYGLDKSFSQIHYSPDTKHLFAIGKDDVDDINVDVHEGALPGFIGKELAEKLLARPAIDNTHPFVKGDTVRSLIGGELAVPQKGMRDFYDRMIPNRLQKLVSKLDPDAKVQLYGHKIDVPGENYPSDANDWKGDEDDWDFKKVHSLEITPKLRAAILKGLPAYEHGGSVDRTKLHYKDVTKRIPQLTEAAASGVGGSEYQALVNIHKPVQVWSHVPPAASFEDMHNALEPRKREKLGKDADIPEGHPVGLRLDIPAYRDHGVWIPTIHDRSGGSNTVLAHAPHARVSNATFNIPQKKAEAVAKGGPKSPFATIDGSWRPTSAEDAQSMAEAYLNHPEWRQVGMDPERHSYFYDRETQDPITHAEEVLQIGPLVLAKNPRYGNREDYSYEYGGSVVDRAFDVLSRLPR